MTSDQQIRTRNREMCERIMKRNVPRLAIELEPLSEWHLSDARYGVLAALAWAYREIDRLESVVSDGVKRVEDSLTVMGEAPGLSCGQLLITLALNAWITQAKTKK